MYHNCCIILFVLKNIAGSYSAKQLRISDEWKEYYNENPSYRSLGGKSPGKYLKTETEEKNRFYFKQIGIITAY